jgi:hypothetical protein
MDADYLKFETFLKSREIFKNIKYNRVARKRCNLSWEKFRIRCFTKMKEYRKLSVI